MRSPRRRSGADQQAALVSVQNGRDCRGSSRGCCPQPTDERQAQAARQDGGMGGRRALGQGDAGHSCGWPARPRPTASGRGQPELRRPADRGADPSASRRPGGVSNRRPMSRMSAARLAKYSSSNSPKSLAIFWTACRWPWARIAAVDRMALTNGVDEGRVVQDQLVHGKDVCATGVEAVRRHGPVLLPPRPAPRGIVATRLGITVVPSACGYERCTSMLPSGAW